MEDNKIIITEKEAINKIKQKLRNREKIMNEELYVDIEDGWYSVFGVNSGKCYAQFGSKEQAEQYINENI